MIHVLITEDHAVVREGLKRIINDVAEFEVVGEAGTADEAITFIRSGRPLDVVLLDITMPGRSGLDVLNVLHIEYPKLPVLVLSMHAEEQYAMRMLKAGASGYLTKESAPEQLVHAVRKVTSGGRYISPALAERLAVQVAGARDQLPHEGLSDREFEVFRQLAAGHTVTEIAEQLSLSVKTISTYRARVLEKMHLDTNAQLIHYAMQHQLLSASSL